ncbi:hypothetical protein IWX47DRAFT_298123 [Phyllosticta citricarpa]
MSTFLHNNHDDVGQVTNHLRRTQEPATTKGPLTGRGRSSSEQKAVTIVIHPNPWGIIHSFTRPSIRHWKSCTITAYAACLKTERQIFRFSERQQTKTDRYSEQSRAEEAHSAVLCCAVLCCVRACGISPCVCVCVCVCVYVCVWYIWCGMCTLREKDVVCLPSVRPHQQERKRCKGTMKRKGKGKQKDQ